MRRTTILVILVALGCLPLVAQGELSPRDIYAFLWKTKLAPGIEPQQKHFVNVAFWWETLKPEVRDRIAGTIKSRTLSDREKKRAIMKEIPAAVYGTVAMEKGQDLSGVIVFEKCSFTPEGDPGIKVAQEGKGTTVIPYSAMAGLQVLEFLRQYGYTARIVIRRADGQMISGKSTNGSEVNCQIFNRQTGALRSSADTKKVTFGGVQTILCPDCFRPMEIDWNFCPYCGIRLPLAGKPRVESRKE